MLKLGAQIDLKPVWGAKGGPKAGFKLNPVVFGQRGIHIRQGGPAPGPKPSRQEAQAERGLGAAKWRQAGQRKPGAPNSEGKGKT